MVILIQKIRNYYLIISKREQTSKNVLNTASLDLDGGIHESGLGSDHVVYFHLHILGQLDRPLGIRGMALMRLVTFFANSEA